MQWLRVRFLGSFFLSTVTGFLLTADAYAGGTHAARFAMSLAALIAVQGLGWRRISFGRELIVYSLFLGYMIITLAWTEDTELGLGIVLLATNFALIMMLLGSLFAYHDLTAVLRGLLLGFLLAAVVYFMIDRFPLVYPEGFSYNTMAGMYLFGLFTTLACSLSLRSRLVPVGLTFVLLLHIAATTSIKTSLGIALGFGAASLIYFRNSLGVMRRNFILLAALIAVVAAAVISNEGLTQRVQGGFARISRGAQILANREDDSGSIGLDNRQYWEKQGLKGWRENPLLGYGVEAFRNDYGITSHSTPIDLLYNSGAIGLCLFYGMFASVAWRVMRARGAALRKFHLVIVAGLVCYSFMTLSATLYYDTFLAAFIAITSGLLSRAAGHSAEATAAASPVAAAAVPQS